MPHEAHYTISYIDKQIMVGICPTSEGSRVRVTVSDASFVLTPSGAEWLADMLNRTADKIRLPIEEH